MHGMTADHITLVLAIETAGIFIAVVAGTGMWLKR
jgi:hypothetical protein